MWIRGIFPQINQYDQGRKVCGLKDGGIHKLYNLRNLNIRLPFCNNLYYIIFRNYHIMFQIEILI